MFRMSLFRIRAFTAGNLAGFLGSVGRGGFQFMLMIWLQGIWLPQHGYSYVDTPLWAGIYMVPFSIGFVLAGPLSGKLSDRYGARPFATGGMLLNAALFVLVMAFPANFSYVPFAVVMTGMGIAGGLFASPNTSSIMNSVPARDRGAASGMRVTFVNVGLPLSMGLFFTLLVLGLNAKVPSAMYNGLVSNGVPAAQAAQLGHVPPLGYLFAAFLGFNPLGSLLGPSVHAHLTAAQWANLTGRRFFPQLVGPGFKHALLYVLAFAIAMSLIAAVASAMRGAKYVHEDDESRAQKARLHRGHAVRAGAKAAVAGAAGAAAPAGHGRPATARAEASSGHDGPLVASAAPVSSAAPIASASLLTSAASVPAAPVHAPPVPSGPEATGASAGQRARWHRRPSKGRPQGAEARRHNAGGREQHRRRGRRFGYQLARSIHGGWDRGAASMAACTRATWRTCRSRPSAWPSRWPRWRPGPKKTAGELGRSVCAELREAGVAGEFSSRSGDVGRELELLADCLPGRPDRGRPFPSPGAAPWRGAPSAAGHGKATGPRGPLKRAGPCPPPRLGPGGQPSTKARRLSGTTRGRPA